MAKIAKYFQGNGLVAGMFFKFLPGLDYGGLK